VKIGELSRGGLTRGAKQARAHDMGWKEKDGPCGIVAEESAELTITCGRAYKTSACIVEALAAKGDAWDDQAQAATRRLQITMDNGPESRGRRTQCLSRMVQLADDRNKPLQRLYDPPYHRK
jgi:hypothetical protein